MADEVINDHIAEVMIQDLVPKLPGIPQ